MAGVTAFAPQLRPVAVPAPARRAWRVLGRRDGPVATAARRLPPPNRPCPTVVAVELGDTYQPEDGARLLQAIAQARAIRARLALFHSGAGGASLLATAAREEPDLTVAAVELPARAAGALTSAAVNSAMALAAGPHPGARQYLVDRAGTARTLDWQPFPLPRPAAPAATPDVVLVTGGLGGLGLRVARTLARERHAHPVLLDTRAPADLPGHERDQLIELLGQPPGATVCRLDLTDAGQVSSAVVRVADRARIRGVVHCAGRIAGGPVARLTSSDLDDLQHVKVQGLRNLLGALDTRRLRFLVAFGSITAVAPHHNVGAYALANELLQRETTRIGHTLPRCTTVTAQWSLWTGAGMAHQMGAVEQARRLGMSPVPLSAGLGTVLRLLSLPPGAATLTLAGGHAPRFDGTERPAARARAGRGQPPATVEMRSATGSFPTYS